MNIDKLFEIKRFDFNDSLTESFYNLDFAKDLWPVVYILSDEAIREAYVGETTDLYARMSAHLKSSKKKLSLFHLVASRKFNKSATLDIESNLIKYISGDGKYQLLNANIGLANHNYYQKKEIYWDVFKSIWHKLRAEGIAKHSIEHIDNSDLFKYSPYKSLTIEQSRSLLAILKNLLNEQVKNTIVEGGAGTGKTILAVFLFKLLNSDLSNFSFKEFGDEEIEFIETVSKLKERYPSPKMALVVPMASFRSTLKKVFKHVKGLNPDMVVAPADITRGRYDIIIVDEAHRLRRRVNLGTYFRAFDDACKRLNMDRAIHTELDWMLTQSEKLVLFYDENQSIKPSDVMAQDFLKLKVSPLTDIRHLKSQLRVRGGKDYVQYVSDLLDCSLQENRQVFNSPEYTFLFFDSIDDMVKEIRRKNEQHDLSRIIAGYSWEWKSKKNKSLFDIQIGDTSLRWNSTSSDWINSRDAINEVGCIHTTQGYDLNYAGIIFGNEISYDNEKNEIIISEKKYFDRNGKASIRDSSELKAYIKNIYKTVLLRGIKGTFVYACNPALREYLSKHVLSAKPQVAGLKTFTGNTAPSAKCIPLYNLKAAAGDFSDWQQVQGEEWVVLPERVKFSEDLFACRVVGESMNKIIPNGSICLFRKYVAGSRNGKIVLVQHVSIQDKDFGSGYTVKEYRSKKIMGDDDQWHHESIILYPVSDDPSFKPIEIKPDELSDLKVVGIFECVMT